MGNTPIMFNVNLMSGLSGNEQKRPKLSETLKLREFNERDEKFIRDRVPHKECIHQV